jgi:hypothetical protein
LQNNELGSVLTSLQTITLEKEAAVVIAASWFHRFIASDVGEDALERRWHLVS